MARGRTLTSQAAFAVPVCKKKSCRRFTQSVPVGQRQFLRNKISKRNRILHRMSCVMETRCVSEEQNDCHKPHSRFGLRCGAKSWQARVHHYQQNPLAHASSLQSWVFCTKWRCTTRAFPKLRCTKLTDGVSRLILPGANFE